MATNSYTLVIPTYNRAEDLARQLRFLAHQKAEFPVLVLDSSTPGVHDKNVRHAKGLALDVRMERFDPAMSPFEKFWRGSKMVRTEYSSLCADDDLILVDSMRKTVEFLENNAEYSVAHGWYFQFYLEKALGLTSILYRSPSVDANDYLDRVYSLLANYEAITYGVHRTWVLERALYHVQSMRSMLARELLGGVLAVIAGKVARLPVLYSGRSLGPSGSYVNWHPVEFLATSPRGLFEEYARYRSTLLEFCAELGMRVGDANQTERRIDLAHMRYASEYFRPEVLDYVYGQVRLGRSKDQLMEGLWPVLSKRSGLVGMLYRNSILRRLRRMYAPRLHEYKLQRLTTPSSYSSLATTTASGAERRVEVYEGFRATVEAGGITPRLLELLAVMAGYE